jgi:solute carrier family 25 uncoupling protein 27
VSSTAAETITFPIDLTKTRLQIQQQRQGTVGYRGALQTASGIVREEGFFKLWRGVTPAVLRHYVYSSRMVFYEYLRDHVFGKNKDGSFDIWVKIRRGCN